MARMMAEMTVSHWAFHLADLLVLWRDNQEPESLQTKC